METREFFEDLKTRLDIKTYEDWYKLSAQQVIQNGGAGLLASYYANSISTAVSSVYPEYRWKMWKFEKAPAGFWDDKRNQREFMDDLASALELNSREDWYRVTVKQVHENGGGGLLEVCYNNSLSRALAEIYPEYKWTFLRSRMPKGYWDEFLHHKKFFDDLAVKLDLKDLDGWYDITNEIILKNGGSSVLNESNSHSHIKALMNVYPEHEWQIWRFRSVPKGHWTSIQNLRSALSELYKRQHFSDWEDWYRIKKSDITEMFGSGLLESFDDSPIKLLTATFPEYPWKPWKFLHLLLTDGFWDKDSNVLDFLDSLREQLQIETLDDWFSVSVEEVQLLGGATLLAKHNGLYGLLSRYYPNHNWTKPTNNFHKDPSKLHSYLHRVVMNLFPPNQDVFVNYSHPMLRYDDEKRSPVEFDIYLPQLRLALELHGKQHFDKEHKLGDPLTASKDERKRQICTANNITLIEVPYWFFSSRDRYRKDQVVQLDS
eukprot:TRINITY_DN7453_c0_g1_i1.p1 TRINITY_DN7453_c0_g1~~TRINITY_DN7453_c0_g1_i1.p1  ORF type:complete len:488 (-),score=137.23 TRINITY_DN7453_c0_g1_i1:47-1510(-)